MRPTRSLLFVFALALVQGCQGCLGCSTSPLDAPDSTIPRTCQAEQPLVQPQKLDILFVIDNSSSMQEEQEGVARELVAFIDALKKSGGVRQDFHVGVITTSVYLHAGTSSGDLWKTWPNAGKLVPVPNELADGGLVLDTKNERFLDGDDPLLASKFGKLVRQGVVGSGQETPFEAVRLALLTDTATTPVSEGGNGGFLRDGARLLVVVVTDEDDCSEMNRPSTVKIGTDPLVDDCLEQGNSLTPVSTYHQLFSEQLVDGQGRRRDILWAAIAPVGRATKQVQAITLGGQVRNIDCPTSNAPGFRHRQLAEMFDPTLANLDSICDDSYRETLVRIAELAGVSQVLEVTNIPDPGVVQVIITRADGSKQTCTTSNKGVEVLEQGTGGAATRLRFQGDCLRRADDTALDMQLLCAI